MITPWYERLNHPFSVVSNKELDYRLNLHGEVYYSRDLNVIINSIAKNCTSSIQSVGRSYGNFQIISMYDPVIAQNPVKPTAYTILRDPVERFISATNMLIGQHRWFGLKITAENFTNLDFVTDQHLMPQINRVFQRPHTDTDLLVLIEDRMLYEFKQIDTWTQLYQVYPYLKHVDTVNQKFYYMEPGHDPVREIFSDIGIALPDHVFTTHNNRHQMQEVQYVESLSTEMMQYVKNFYEPDYKLIELVNFKNK